MHSFASPMHALPLDIVRVLAGCVLFVYFLNALRQARDFGDPEGLIDHGLVARLFPPTRIALFQPGMPGWVFRAVHLAACAAAVCVVVGWHPRAAAAFLFAAAVSTYRWNALVAYLDDCIVHVFCLWLVLLPVGATLNVAELLGGALPDTWARWSQATIPGGAPRAFMANMALVYVVAGAYKFASPMWRGGSAMHAALKMPIARGPGFWTLRHRGCLRVVTWAALVLEPLFALVFVLPADSTARWGLIAAAAVFHLGIVATLKITYSNALMLAALAAPALGSSIGAGVLPGPSAWGPAEVAGVTLVALLAAMFAWEAALAGRRLAQVGMPYSQRGWANPIRALLWMAGVFQSYRLFDWVDHRNYHVDYEVRCGDARIDPRSLFPETMRHLLLQSYLVGSIWLQMEPAKLDEVRRSILVRHARRFARLHPNAGRVEAVAVVQRITPDNLDLTRGERRFLMGFTCRDGHAVMEKARQTEDNITPALSSDC